jgi:hypothetical protein
MHKRQFGFPDARSRVSLRRSPISLHTIDVSACFASTRELLVACRLVLTDLYQAFGIPEVEQIHEDGHLRRRYFAEFAQSHLIAWAEGEGVEVLETTLEQEQQATT